MSNISGAKFSVTSQTSISDLQEFLSHNKVTDQSKLRGLKQGEGYVVYVESRSSSMLDRLTGKARQRNRDAEAGIRMVFANLERTAAAAGLDVGRPGAGLIGSLSRSVVREGRRALRGDAVLGRANAAKLLTEKATLSLNVGSATPSERRNVALAQGANLKLKFDGSGLKAVAVSVARAGGVEHAEDAGEAAATIGDHLVRAIKGSGASEGDVIALMLSKGIEVKGQLRGELVGAGLGDLGDQRLGQIVDGAFDRAADQLLGTSRVGEMVEFNPDDRGLELSDLPNLRMADGLYEPSKELGVGSFGGVFLFRQVDAPDGREPKTMAVKFAVALGDKELGTAIGEALSHRTASSTGSENILGYKGAVRCGGGRVAIAMDTAPNGSVGDVGFGIGAVTGAGKGQLSRTEAAAAKLTLLKDMLQGLSDMHAQKQLHLDFKAGNCLLGADGRAKIIDFGTTRSGESIRTPELDEGIINPSYLSPEFIRNKLQTAASLKEAAAAFGADRPGVGLHDLRAALQSRVEADILTSSAQDIGRSHDVWGAGTAAVELFSGEKINDGRRDEELEDHLVAWSGQNDAKAIDASPGASLSLMSSTGDADIDDLINHLLHPDPNQRISADDALRHVAFAKPNVGSPELRQMLPAVAEASKAGKKMIEVDYELAIISKQLRNQYLSKTPELFDGRQNARIKQADRLTSAEAEVMIDRLPGPERDKAKRYYDQLVEVEREKRVPLEKQLAAVGERIEAGKANLAASSPPRPMSGRATASDLPPAPTRPVPRPPIDEDRSTGSVRDPAHGMSSPFRPRSGRATASDLPPAPTRPAPRPPNDADLSTRSVHDLTYGMPFRG